MSLTFFFLHNQDKAGGPCQGQTLAYSTRPGPSLEAAVFMLSTHVSVELKVENSAQTTFRFSPVRSRSPAMPMTSLFILFYLHVTLTDENYI